MAPAVALIYTISYCIEKKKWYHYLWHRPTTWREKINSSNQQAISFGYLGVKEGYLDWIYCLTLLQPTRLQKIQILQRDGAKKFSDSPGEILYCFLKKTSGGALLSTSMWMGSGPCSRKKSLKNIPSVTIPLWMEQPALNKTVEWLHFMTDFKS